MKTALFLRHAKAKPADSPDGDHERPLTARGMRAALRVGETLRIRGLVPDALFSSTARRALDTASAVARGCGYEADLVARRALYLATVADTFDALRALSEGVARPLFVGHNPALAELVTALAGRDVSFPPAALAVVRFSAPCWDAVDARAPGALVELILPTED